MSTPVVTEAQHDFRRPPRTVATTATATGTAPADAAGRLLAALDAGREFSYLSSIADSRFQGRRTGTAGARAAADYIATQFSNLGLQPWAAAGFADYSVPFTSEGYQSENVIGVLPGNDPGGAFVILGAHYDHLGLDGSGRPFNGADDNAAGVAALLETATIFQQTGIRPKNTIVFCAFSGEEVGELGSAALGQLLVDTGIAARVEMINVDGIGATGGDYFGVWDEGASNAAPLVQALKQAGSTLGTPVREEGTDIGSDAQSFDWLYSIPAVTVDWSWGSDPSLWHPNYHTIYDTPDQINQAVMAQATKVALLGLWLRANA